MAPLSSLFRFTPPSREQKLRPTRIRDKKHEKNCISYCTTWSGLGFNGANAQNKDLSLGIQGAFNFNKTGIGARFGYNFTDILRFTIDGTYYLTAKKTMDVFQGNEITRTLNNGRLWDGNINLNFVYGRNNFHFYLISGVGFAYGYKFNGLITDVLGAFAYDHTDANGNSLGYGIDENQVTEFTHIGVLLNAGFGIEWQIAPFIRWNHEQTLSLGLPSMSTWMSKTCLAFCF